MITSSHYSASSFRSREFQLICLFFLIVWAYIIARACLVFYTYDEIFTKWNYVVDWNPLPYDGIVDANNHFLFSLFSGLFVKLFHSDGIFVVRLPSILAFPVYFWSVYGLRKFFQSKWNFYGCLLALTATPFLLEFFSMARGYGLALAFLLFAVLQTMNYAKENQKRFFYWALFGWIMAVSASLTLLALSIVAILYLAVCAIRRKFYWGFLPIALLVTPISYYINYSFFLKDLGKLYYGGTDGFVESTVTSCAWFVLRNNGNLLKITLFVAACFIVFTIIRRLIKVRAIFDAKLIFPFFLVVWIASVLVQHRFLGVKYPIDRTALALIVFFFGAFFNALDEWRFGKWIALVLPVVWLVIFIPLINFSHTLLFDYEHMEPELIKSIPYEVKGTPPTTAGKWNMENELNRSLDLPLRLFQSRIQSKDTLADYVISDQVVLEGYDVVYTDPISRKVLLKRGQFLNRVKIFEGTEAIDASEESQVLVSEQIKHPILIRLEGEIKQKTSEKDIFIDFYTLDTISGQAITLERFSLRENKKVDDDGVLRFDFSYAMSIPEGAAFFEIMAWHRSKHEIDGRVKVEVYRLEE